MKKRLVGAAICAAAIIGTAGSVSAGEINGKGEKNAIGERQAHNSLCAYSGLQDGTGPDDPIREPGHVQTPHGEPDYDLYFPPGSASGCQWLNNSQWGGHSQRPQDPPPPPEE